MNQLFQCMFSDSEIAKDFQLSHIKLTYITNFGIAPYFHHLLIDELKNSNYYSLSFDESLNDFTQTCQMDINIRFWSKAKKKACVRYFDSKLLGHATANDILASFNEIINTIDSGNKMIQISMDGPSTNWKLFEPNQKDREEKEQKTLLDIGSCSLHTIHVAFKSGAEKNGWDIKSIFKAAYTILLDTPARREEFISVTGEERVPLFVCARWVEDTVVADRLIEIWESITKTVKYWERLPKSKQPSSKSFFKVQDAVNDKFILAKFHFFSFFGSIFKSFLTKYQTRWPMVPFMYDDSKNLVKRILQLYIEQSVIDNCSKISTC